MPEHKWAPPERPDVTLHQPIGFSVELAGTVSTIDPPQPVYADIDYETIPGALHLCRALRSLRPRWRCSSRRRGRGVGRKSLLAATTCSPARSRQGVVDG